MGWGVQRRMMSMRRIAIVLPGLIGEPSVLSRGLSGLHRLAEMGEITRLSPTPEAETPEAMWLGMAPDQGQLRPGPLVVSALGADPPERSTHFCLTLMSARDGVASPISLAIPPEEVRAILSLAKKLETRTLKIIEGRGTEHGLVWEDVGALRSSAPMDIEKRQIAEHLPEGDAEIVLRRFIDDSVNLLSEDEINQRRLDDDLPPLNLLWPWGEGIRLPLPNLALRRGGPAQVFSDSLRLAGLTRLVGYRRHALTGNGLQIDWSKISSGPEATIVASPIFADLRAAGRFDEMEWLIREVDRRLIQPLLTPEPVRIGLFAPGDGEGLGVVFESGREIQASIPFDERALEDRRLPRRPIWECIEAAVL